MPEPHQHVQGPLEVLVVSHTHWDREWYRTAGEFRQMLVALIDELLDDPATTPFLLDGQSILLADYLDVRPERAAELRHAFRTGLLEAGPWYVLADELIPSGEALVRNLLAGCRLLKSIGATAPPVLYSPDAFGHPAALPELAHGFGATLTIVWRGYGGARWPSGDVVRWSAPSGRESLMLHLAPDGYELGASLPPEVEPARDRWAHLRAVLAPRSRLGVVFLPNGADHHARQRGLTVALASLAQAAAPDQVRAASLSELADSLLARAAASRLPRVGGELRDSYGYTWTLGGTLASRAGQKQRNARMERLLTRDCEPWLAYALRKGDLTHASLLDAAWRMLLSCHPHDSLCGCSSDDVASAVDIRLLSAGRDATFLRDHALPSLLGHDPDVARQRQTEWTSVLLVRNRAALKRSGLAEVEVDVSLGPVAVGPGSASAPKALPHVQSLGRFEAASPLQLLSRTRLHVREESPRGYPRNELMERQRGLIWVDDVPAYGIAAHASGRASRALPPVHARTRSTETGGANEHVSVEVGAAGINISCGNRVVHDVISFESEADRGDLYTPSPVPDSRRLGALRRWRITAKGPLRAEVTTWWTVPVAPRDIVSATGARVRHRAGRIRVVARFQVDAGAEFVRVALEGYSDVPDARLRLRVQTSLQGASTWADAMFGDVERRPLLLDAAAQVHEQVQHGAPLHRFVSRYTAGAGVTLFSDGLAEYEAFDDGSITVTLVRGVGELSRADLPERPGHAGWPVNTPAAQSHGPFNANMAIALHGPRTRDQVCAIHRLADDVLLPLVGATWRSAINPPARFDGISLDGDGLAFSTMKSSEDRTWTVVRCVNVLDDWTHGEWRLPNVTDAFLARLDEVPLGALSVVDGAVGFHAPPHGVVTILLR